VCGNAEHNRVTFLGISAHVPIAAVVQAWWIVLRHIDAIVEFELILQPFGYIVCRVVEVVGTLTFVVAIHGCQNGDLVDMVSAEHRGGEGWG
jgi:hypothetical protein